MNRFDRYNLGTDTSIAMCGKVRWGIVTSGLGIRRKGELNRRWGETTNPECRVDATWDSEGKFRRGVNKRLGKILGEKKTRAKGHFAHIKVMV